MENKENLTVSTVSQYEPKLNYSSVVNEIKKSLQNQEDLSVQGNQYAASYGNGGDFIYFKRTEGESAGDIEGLKFHVSVDPQKMNEAWKIVMDVMAKYGVREAKIANPMIDKPQEPGKEITLYAFKEKPTRPIAKSDKNNVVSWEEIIGELTIQLHNAGIQPGTAATSNSQGGGIEHTIGGTNYVTWRDDFNMMENVKAKISPDQIPSDLKTKDFDNYFETVDISLNPENEDDMDYKIKLFSYYYENLENFKKLSNNLNMQLNEQQIVQQDRLPSDEHIQRRENRYIDIRNTPIFLERKKQTFGSNVQILQQLTSPNTSVPKIDKVNIQSHEQEVRQETSHMSKRKQKGLGGNYDFLKQTFNKGQESPKTQQNFSTTNVNSQQDHSSTISTTKKKDLPPIPPRTNVNTSQTIHDNDFRRRLEGIVSKQNPNTTSNPKQDESNQTDKTQKQNDTSGNTKRFI